MKTMRQSTPPRSSRSTVGIAIPTDPLHPTVLHGRAQTLIARLPDDSVDAVVTDPPYELNFGRIAGHGWDATGIAFDLAFWKQVHRVMKPGGNLVAFGAPRAYHHLTTVIEEAEFEVRDNVLAWVKSSGFPKSQKLARQLARKDQPLLSQMWEGWGTGLKPAHEPIVVARKAPDGTLLDNIVRHHVGGINIDAGRIPTDDDRSRTPGRSAVGDIINVQRGGTAKNESHEGGRWPTNMLLIHRPDCVEDGQCDEDCAALELDAQSPGSSRFFPSFYYSGRAARSERPVANGVEHLSVKPLGVMEWLVGISAMPGALILDPFAGSGATIEAAMRLGVRAIGFEMTPEYIPLIDVRVHRARACGLADEGTSLAAAA